MNKRIVLNVLLIVVALFLLSCESGSPKISIRGPRLVGVGDYAVFLLIVNDGKGSDTLSGGLITGFPSARVELHDVLDGKMVEIKKIEIPAGEIVPLKAGSKHIMIFGLPEEISEELTLILKFQKSGSIDVKIPVKS
jgi:copper(I)-binding protein